MNTKTRLQNSWTPAQLYQRIMRREHFQILDVRTRQEFDAWPIETLDTCPITNIPYIDFLDLDETDDVVRAALNALPTKVEPHLNRWLPVLVVCPYGSTSGYVAEALRKRDYLAVNLAGGMAAWGDHYHCETISRTDNYELYQFIRPARGCLSHVAISDGEGVIIDPGRHTGQYLEFLQGKGAELSAILDTHMHADHISGGPRLSEETKVRYYLHPYDAIHPIDMLPARFDYTYLRDGETLTFGSLALKVIAIPGHTIGEVAFVAPAFGLFGDSIFMRSIARPDLGGKPDQWTPLLYRSLRRILELPGDLICLPAHFSALTEMNDSGVFSAPLGYLSVYNAGLRMVQEDEETFSRYIMESLPEFPDSYVDIKRINAGLMVADEAKAQELELGKNVCALK